MKLSQIQNKFEDHITRTGKDIDSDFAALYESGNIPLDERLRVYRDNIIMGLADMLMGAYPTLSVLTGEAFTLGLIRAYVRNNLPKQGCLDTYGQDLAEFIERFEPANTLPYLPDIARLDWAMSACEHAEDDVALSTHDLQTLLETENFTLTLRSSAFVISSEFPILTLRAYALDPQNDQKPPPSLNNNPEYALVYRPHLKAQCIALSKAEFEIFDNLYRFKSLEESIENTLKSHQGFDFNVFLQKFMALETFRNAHANK